MSSNHQCPLDKLQQKQDSVPYHCNACKEVGFGSRYWCEQCNNYALHPCCQERKPTIELNFYENRKFKLPKSQTSNPTEKFCIACGRNIRGMYYESDKFYLHPSCATLLPKIQLQVGFDCPYKSKTGVQRFQQKQKMTLHAKNEICEECCRCHHMHHLNRPVSWSYKLDKDHFLHVACIEEMEIEKWENINASARVEGSSSQKCEKERKREQRK